MADIITKAKKVIMRLCKECEIDVCADSPSDLCLAIEELRQEVLIYEAKKLGIPEHQQK